jgi:hypothetical protein
MGLCRLFSPELKDWVFGSSHLYMLIISNTGIKIKLLCLTWLYMGTMDHVKRALWEKMILVVYFLGRENPQISHAFFCLSYPEWFGQNELSESFRYSESLSLRFVSTFDFY